MDLGPLRPYTWAVLLGLFVPLSWILEVMLGPAAIVFARSDPLTPRPMSSAPPRTRGVK